MKKFTFLILALIFSANIFAQTDSTRYKAVVQFGSRGDGVASNDAILSYVKTFKKTYKVKAIKYDRIGPMGREGEYWMAFSLRELTAKQRAVFIKKLKSVTAAMKGRGYAGVEENVAVASAEFAAKTTHNKL